MSDHNLKIADMFEEALDHIYGALENTAKEYKTTSVPLNLVKQFHDMYKKNFREGIKGKK